MPNISPTVLAWRSAATTAFSAMLAEQLKLPPAKLNVELSVHKSTAAVRWTKTYYGTVDVVLYLPRMDMNARLTRTQADTLTGYWVHEAGHVLYTPADGMTRNAHRGGGFLRLLNGLEDVRMEGAIIAGAPMSNARSVLTAISRYVAIKGTSAADPVGDANEWHNLPWTLAYLGRADVNGYALGDHLDAYRATLNPINRAHVTEALRRLAACSTFEEVEALAEWIYNDVFPAWDHGRGAQNPGNPEGEGEGSEGSEGEGQSAEGESAEGEGQSAEGEGQSAEGEGEGEGQSAEGEGEGQSAEGEGQSAEGEGEGEGQSAEGEGPRAEGDAAEGGKGAGEGGNIPDRDDMRDADADADAIAEEVNRNISERELAEQYDARSGNDAAATAKVQPAPAPRSRNIRERHYTDLRDAFTGVHAVKAQVRRLFEAPEHYALNRHQERGRFDPQAAARVTWGALDVFAVAEEAPGYSTAVQVMLDGSSSMTGQNMRSALGMAAQIAEVAQAKACPCQVDVFQGNTLELRVTRLLSFGGRMDPRTRLVFAAMATEARGGTPLAAAVTHGGMSLDARGEARRLLVVLTDGSNDKGPTPVANAVRVLRARGVAVVALGLGLWEGGSDKVNFDASFRGADAAATSETHDLATHALRAIADALAHHAWGMVASRPGRAA